MASIFDEEIQISENFIKTKGFNYEETSFITGRPRFRAKYYRSMKSSNGKDWDLITPAFIYLNWDPVKYEWEMKVQYTVYDGTYGINKYKFKYIARISTELEFELAWQKAKDFCDNLYK